MKFLHFFASISALLLSSLLIVSPVLFSFPSSAFATTCGVGSAIGGGQCRGYITSGGTWPVPSDWSSTNTIEVIGAGGGGADGNNSVDAGAGGGGGAYASTTNLSLTPSGSINIQVCTA